MEITYRHTIKLPGFCATAVDQIDPKTVSLPVILTKISLTSQHWIFFRAHCAKDTIATLAVRTSVTALLINGGEDEPLSGYLQFENRVNAKSFVRQAERFEEEPSVEKFHHQHLSGKKGPNTLRVAREVRLFVDKMFADLD